MLLSAEIQLLPDKTFFLQLVLFLVVAVSLNHFVFKPVLKILNLRKMRTKGDRAKIEELMTKTQNLIKEYEAKMKEAKIEGVKIKEAIRREGEGQGQKIVHEAKQASLEQIEKIKQEIEMESKKASEQLEQQAKTLGKDMAEKILGRPIN